MNTATHRNAGPALVLPVLATLVLAALAALVLPVHTALAGARSPARTAMLLATLLAASVPATGCGGGGAEVRALSPDSLAVWLAEARPVVILDTRARNRFEAMHLPGAVAAEGRTVSQLKDVLPLDPAIPVVVYGLGDPLEPNAYDVAGHAAGTYGFPLVYRLEGGIRVWSERGYEADGNDVLGEERRMRAGGG